MVVNPIPDACPHTMLAQSMLAVKIKTIWMRFGVMSTCRPILRSIS